METNQQILDRVKYEAKNNPEYGGFISDRELFIVEAYHQAKLKQDAPNPNEGWVGWLCTRIPSLNGNGAYRFWIKQAFEGWYEEKLKQLAPSDEDKFDKIEESWGNFNLRYKNGVNKLDYQLGFNTAITWMRDQFIKPKE